MDGVLFSPIRSRPSQRLRKNHPGAARAADVLTRGFLHLPSSSRLAASAFHSWRGLRPRLLSPLGEVREGGEAPLPLISAPAQVPAHEPRAGGQRGDLPVAHAPRAPAEAALGVDVETLGRPDLGAPPA